jgi:acyl-CoA thioesterase-1
MPRKSIYRSFFFIAVLFSYGAIGKTRVLILGDSLTEGYGVSKESAYPYLLEQKIKKTGKDVEIINGGNSGATTASGVSRLRWYLKEPIQLVLIALGANDGLRGMKLEATENNLTSMIDFSKSRQVKVVLVGMKLPPNYGPQYVKDFTALFKRIVEKEKIPFIPFLLEGVGGDVSLNQEDGIHPNEKGHQKIANYLYPFLEKQL